MPWPPTGMIEPLIDLETQLSSPGTPGVSATTTETPGLSLAYNPANGVVAPGVGRMYEPDFSALPDPQEEHLKLPEVGKQRELVVKYVQEKLGKLYVWGGESDSEGGFDCSGLLWQAFKRAGIDMPRISWSQAARGKKVGLKDLQPGDLVAWDHNPNDGGADHIALYIGNGEIIEAPSTWVTVNGKRVRGTVRRRKLGANEGAWGVKLNY